MKSTDPKDHIGHTVVIDKFAQDFGRRRESGNGWCADCQCAVTIEVFNGGTFTQKDYDTSVKIGEQDKGN